MGKKCECGEVAIYILDGEPICYDCMREALLTPSDFAKPKVLQQITSEGKLITRLLEVGFNVR